MVEEGKFRETVLPFECFSIDIPPSGKERRYPQFTIF
jgi:hypothetical protein